MYFLRWVEDLLCLLLDIFRLDILNFGTITGVGSTKRIAQRQAAIGMIKKIEIWSPNLLDTNDVENIADGIFSPLEGFLNQQDFESVISKGRLANGTAWTMPTVFDVDEETGKKMKDAGDVLLKNPDGTGIAVLHVEDVYS